jgi:transposase
MVKQRWKLTDAQWQKIEPLLPKPKKSKRGGRPWAHNRKVFEGILRILRTGAPWADLPKQYPSPSTCWRRLRDWEEQGVWLRAWRAFLAQLDEKGQWECVRTIRPAAVMASKDTRPSFQEPVSDLAAI